jgi:hypothetical protein
LNKRCECHLDVVRAGCLHDLDLLMWWTAPAPGDESP